MIRGVIVATLAVCVAAEYAHIVAWKRIPFDEPVVAEKPITVTVGLWNRGNGAARDVSVADTWPPSVSITEGDTDKLFEEIPAHTNVSYSYKISIPNPGVIGTDGAHITYRGPAGNDTVAESNRIPEILVVDAAAYARATASNARNIAAFVILAAVPILLPFLIYRNRHSQLVEMTERK
eukprot:TRINITY_DN3344_c0_g2_i1.p2 TRINITY_DN3344_c0_g2~~TRINITY_DN3344_c0_g2_i1.p2  ORF type:complete len:179 (+),score=42.50 TRINITY_DN3344_c0_g2_i1:68-604(+)